MPPLTLLTINPDEVLVFTNTRMNDPRTSLTLTNISKVHVAFKVKTTAPKSYLVKPIHGTMKPGEKQEVHITLKRVPDLSVSEHSFLIQALKTSCPGEVLSSQWSSISEQIIQSARMNVQLDEPVNLPPDAKKQFDELNKRLKEKHALLDEQRAFAEKSESTSSSGRYTALHLMLVVIITILLTVATKSFLPSEAL